MKVFKKYSYAKIYLAFINFYIPLRLKIKNQHLVRNNSCIFQEQNEQKKFIVFELFVTREMLKNHLKTNLYNQKNITINE